MQFGTRPLSGWRKRKWLRFAFRHISSVNLSILSQTVKIRRACPAWHSTEAGEFAAPEHIIYYTLIPAFKSHKSIKFTFQIIFTKPSRQIQLYSLYL